MGSALAQDLLMSEFSRVLPLEHVWVYRAISMTRVTELRESLQKRMHAGCRFLGGLRDGESGN